MKFNWKSKSLRVAVAIFFLCVANAATAQTRKTPAAKPVDPNAQAKPIDEKDVAYCKQFLDKDGGYRNKKGGYYNPKAGTYTDEAGGVVDNWGGYTYKDGSYKSRFGDFYDSKANVVKTTDGQTIKAEPGITPAQIIQVMREDVKANGGYDKDLVRRSMIQDIKFEHPIAHQ
jgi:hypothetical protein